MGKTTSNYAESSIDSAPSRRDFLKVAGLAGVTAVAGTSAAKGLTGGSVAHAEETESSGEATEDSGSDMASTGTATNAYDYEVFETDVLIIGGGNAATAVAWSAIKDDVRVLMVDKGPLALSGSHYTSTFNIGFDFEPETPLGEYQCDWLGEPLGDLMLNTQLYRNAFNLFVEGGRDEDLRNLGCTMVNRGEYLATRDEEGALVPYVNNMTQGIYKIHELDTLLSRGLVTAVENTMVTDLVIEDGVCCGAIGLDLQTGRTRVFRAKATVMTTAAPCTAYGRIGPRPSSSASLDNTGDVEMAAWRHGIPIGESEYGQYDCRQVNPRAIAHSPGWALYCDAQYAEDIYDAEGNRIFEDLEKANDRNYFCQTIGEKEQEGAIYLIPSDPSEATIAISAAFGVDITSDPVEVQTSLFDKGGAPVVDENLMTEVSGLFCSRGTGTYGESGGTCIFENFIFGNYAGYTAATYAKELDAVPSFDWQLVDDEMQRLLDIRYNESENGIRPATIRRSIQAAFHDAFDTYRKESVMEAAVAELERIKEEDLPNQIVADASDVFNRDWREAIENYNLVDEALMSVKATLERKESRGSYIREAYPDRDDENWACLLVCKNEDGEMVFEKQDFTEVVD